MIVLKVNDIVQQLSQRLYVMYKRIDQVPKENHRNEKNLFEFKVQFLHRKNLII